MIFQYKSRFKEDYTTGIDLKYVDNDRNKITINPLGYLGAGVRTPPVRKIEDVKIGEILDIAYNKFKTIMGAEEYPVKELEKILLPKETGTTFTPLKTYKGTIFVDKTNLRSGTNKRINRNDSLKSHVDSKNIIINNRIEINFVRDNSFISQNSGFRDSVYVFQYA